MTSATTTGADSAQASQVPLRASGCSLKSIGWGELRAFDPIKRAPYFNNDRGEDHVLLAQQFDRRRLDEIGHLATVIRQISKDNDGARFLRSVLSTKRTMLYFTQPSSRTFLSFRSACQILGIENSEIRDTSTSSEIKGESHEDSVRTFSSYCDLIVMRTPMPGFAERMAWVLAQSDRPLPIMNAGSGKDQHPTQAVLDVYTLQRSFENQGGIDGKRIVFVGDLLRGRTVRSLAHLLTKYDDVQMDFVAPDELQLGEDIQAMLSNAGIRFSLSNKLEPHLSIADAIYMTRVQDEWDAEKGESGKVDITRFHLKPSHLDELGPQSVIMHPFPRREEIPTTIDNDPRAVYWRQMRNGMWIRTALIARIFGVDEEILDNARRSTS